MSPDLKSVGAFWLHEAIVVGLLLRFLGVLTVRMFSLILAAALDFLFGGYD